MNVVFVGFHHFNIKIRHRSNGSEDALYIIIDLTNEHCLTILADENKMAL
jgi:hypothetical protein